MYHLVIYVTICANTRNQPFYTTFTHALRIPPHIFTHWEYRLTFPPPALLPAPNGSDQRRSRLSKNHNHLLLSPSSFPRGNKYNSIFPPPSALNMQSPEKGSRPIRCLFPQQVVYLQNHYISDTKINTCVFPQLSPCLHLPRHVSPTELLS